jgi:hypothetical protein
MIIDFHASLSLFMASTVCELLSHEERSRMGKPQKPSAVVSQTQDVSKLPDRSEMLLRRKNFQCGKRPEEMFHVQVSIESRCSRGKREGSLIKAYQACQVQGRWRELHHRARIWKAELAA